MLYQCANNIEVKVDLQKDVYRNIGNLEIIITNAIHCIIKGLSVTVRFYIYAHFSYRILNQFHKQYHNLCSSFFVSFLQIKFALNQLYQIEHCLP